MIYDVSGNVLSDAYTVDGINLDTVYDIDGNVVFTKGSHVDYSNYSIGIYCTVTLTPTQGFDIHNDIIFQFMSNDRLATINSKNYSIINDNISTACDHGNSASFSDEYYEDTDEFPLIYVTGTNKVYVNRVTQTSSELIRTYTLPSEKIGYSASSCLDFENEILYMAGYSENSYSDENGGSNKTVISKWDMSNLTNNGDGTYTPAFISSYERPFIRTIQGLQFHDGMLWISSGGSNDRGYVYALNPVNGELLYTVDSGTTTEIEGISFISDREMVFGLQGGAYKKVTFSYG